MKITTLCNQRLLPHLIFAVGVAWRFYFIFFAHPPLQHVYSDMSGYFGHAKDFFKPGFSPNIGNTLVPPGTAIYFALTFLLDSSWTLAACMQFILACAVPLLVRGISRTLYDYRTANIAYIIASLYFPFIHYYGFFLSEGPYLFSVLLSFYLLAQALTIQSRFLLGIFALAAGAALALAASFKNSVGGPALLLGMTYLLFAIRHRYKAVPLVVGRILLGMAPLLIFMSIRCTSLNEGKFCLISQNSAHNILMGHFEKRGLFVWTNHEKNYTFGFGSPAVAQKCFQETINLPFGIFDAEKNFEYTWRWISENPVQAFLVSIENVFDLFGGTVFWPVDNRPWQAFFSQIFEVFILLPALFFCLLQFPLFRRLDRESFHDALVLAPILGIMFTVFLTLAEPRYRIPFDGFLIILAARFYASDFFRKMLNKKPEAG